MKRTCSVDGCDRTYLARDFCSMHWQRWNTHGDPGPAEPIKKQHARCKVEGCGRIHYGQGYCSPHLRRWLRNGDHGPAKILERIPREICTVVDCEDEHSARGYCASHYARWNRTGDAGRAFSVRRRSPAIRNEAGQKQCRTCDEWKPETAYCLVTASPDGRSPNCKDCHYDRFIARRYGVDPAWYREALAAQGGGCAICGARPGRRKLNVDHDHSHCARDKGCRVCVRGLLCGPCNTGLGMFNDDAGRIRAASAYMASWAGQ